MHRNVLFAALALALPTPAWAGDAMDTFHLGAHFCGFVQDGEKVMRLDALITPSLAVAISEALARSDAMQAASPDEKPPLGDGIPWTSWPDRPDTCTIGAADISADQATLPITYAFEGAPDAAYTDILLLSREVGTWRINDILLADEQRLRTVIVAAFEN